MRGYLCLLAMLAEHQHVLFIECLHLSLRSAATYRMPPLKNYRFPEKSKIFPEKSKIFFFGFDSNEWP